MYGTQSIANHNVQRTADKQRSEAMLLLPADNYGYWIETYLVDNYLWNNDVIYTIKTVPLPQTFLMLIIKNALKYALMSKKYTYTPPQDVTSQLFLS